MSQFQSHSDKSTEVFPAKKQLGNTPTLWVKDDLITNTIDVWSKVYGRSISEAEAVEILLNLRNFVWVSLRVVQDKD